MWKEGRILTQEDLLSHIQNNIVILRGMAEKYENVSNSMSDDILLLEDMIKNHAESAKAFPEYAVYLLSINTRLNSLLTSIRTLNKGVPRIGEQ